MLAEDPLRGNPSRGWVELAVAVAGWGMPTPRKLRGWAKADPAVVPVRTVRYEDVELVDRWLVTAQEIFVSET